jgi:hypothetical protein
MFKGSGEIISAQKPVHSAREAKKPDPDPVKAYSLFVSMAQRIRLFLRGVMAVLRGSLFCGSYHTAIFIALLLLGWMLSLPASAQPQTLISFDSTWRYRKGTNEVSTPTSAWRTNGFDDAIWTPSSAPFSYGTNATGRDDGVQTGTVLNDMLNGYRGIFLRRHFVVTNVAEIETAYLTIFCDDGFVAWINGTEVRRTNVLAASPLYTTVASTSREADPPMVLVIPNVPATYLVLGTNVLAVQAFNSAINNSDFRFEASLQFIKSEPPTVVAVTPTANSTLSSFTQITVTFTKSVTGVDAADLVVNGQPATMVDTAGPANQFTFTFPQPLPGLVFVGWDESHGITDLNTNPFDANAPNASWFYLVTDFNMPYVNETTPAPKVRVSRLTQVEIVFNEPVTGVDASDLLVNGLPATNMTGTLAGPYVFLFPQPAAGPVQFTWAGGHGITDTAVSPNVFGGGGWTNTLDTALGLPTVRINEFLASNTDTNGLKDEFGELEDWIELHNFGSNAIDLTGCALTDNPSQPGRWTLPPVTLNPDQFLVLFASGRDRKLVGGTNNLHTSFSLGSGGEYLGLFNAESPRVVIDEIAPEYPDQRSNYSYGRDTADALRYFTPPTPGAANGNSTITGVVANVNFSVGRGFFNQAFTLLLTTLTPGATIRYTTDGTVPTESNGATYSNGLVITQLAKLRATAYRTNMLPARVETHTYIFLTNVLKQPVNPPGFPRIIWNNSGQRGDFAMDQRIVTNSPYKATITNDLLSLPALSIVLYTEDMFGVSGIYPNITANVLTEVPCSIELIHPDGSEGFQIDAGIRQHGGSSRNNPMKKPFALKFRGKYGAGKLRFRLFPDTQVDEFNSLVLRPDFNNAWTHSTAADQRARGGLVRDAFFKDVFRAMGALSSHSRYVHLYINGLYWGVYNPCEDPDNDFAAAHLGGDGSQYDAIKGASSTLSVDGDLAAYNTMLSLNNPGLANSWQYDWMKQYLDVVQFADYMVLQLYGGNNDWGTRQNWATVRPRTNGGTFKWICWDNERVLEGTNDNLIGNSPENLQSYLTSNAEYRLLFADRVHKHLFNDGALTPTRMAQMWMARATQIDRAMVAESARWGDAAYGGKPTLSPLPYPGYTTNLPYTREENWLGEQGRLLTNYFPVRTGIVIDQFRSAGWYPFLDAPEYNQFGGRVASGFSLEMTSTSGTTYYTLNGADPRVYGTSAVSEDAMIYTDPITLTSNVVVKARVLDSGTWSALTEAEFTVGGLGIPLRITEIMYNPSGGAAYEYLEMQNSGAVPIDVGGFSFDGITFLVPNGTLLQPGAMLLLANSTSPSQFAMRYPGTTVFGYFTGNLDNAGERIAILDRDGQIVTAVHYDDSAGWPTSADGGGSSLEIVDLHGNPNAPSNWRASLAPNGTPGLPPSQPAASNVVLNEIAADNLVSVTNSGLFPDWIELHNRGTNTVSLAGWSLSDDSNARKFVIPAGTNLAAGDYLVVWCDSATNAAGMHAGFSLARNGETVSLFDSYTNRVDAITFGLQLTDRTVGRVGNTWTLTIPTPNATNMAESLASSTNLVVNEWLANPAADGQDWLELFNRSSNAPVALNGLYLSTSNALFQYAAPSFLAPGGYVQLYADELAGADQLEFKLPAAGGAIVLSDATGLEFERVTYGAQSTAVSQGRFPDGGTNITSFPGSTSPAASNYLLNYTGAVLNEVMARYDSITNGSDWVELFNPNGTPFNLSGMGLGDAPNEPAQWLFPNGTTVGANDYLVVDFDSSRAASTNGGASLNTGHSLSGESGGVYLFNANGQPVDVVEYGFQIKNQSVGRHGGTWQLLATPTPAAENSTPATLGPLAGVRINEWLANSTTDGDWLELYNTNALPVSLSGVYLTDDPSLAGQTKFEIGALSFIPPRGWVQFFADDEPGDGRDHANFRLNELGESLLLFTTNLSVVNSVAFGLQEFSVSQGPLPDGGNTVVPFPTTSTPGKANYLPLTSGVVINEVLTHTDPPLTDAVELFNPAGTNVAIGGWYLSNDQDDLKRYRITNAASISAGGFQVFYEDQFNGPDATNPFALNAAHGDQVWLSEADASGTLTGYRTGVSFGAAENGVSFGRYQTSLGVDFVALSARTFGTDNPATTNEFFTGTGLLNAYPKVGPVVISEIMYHPPDIISGTNFLDDSTNEFIELCNVTGGAVPLFDPATPANTWSLANGIDFAFPTNVTLAPSECVLVVNFNPTNTPMLNAFRSRYAIGGGIRIFGPYSGKLDNSGETLELYKPDPAQLAPHPDAGFVPQVLVEKIAYSDIAPWPPGADGGGGSLKRTAVSAYGNDPVNWSAAAPTAGSSEVTDTDADGMPDNWEVANGTNPLVSDAGIDMDMDGHSNYSEYLTGTSPTNAASALKIESASLTGSDLTFNFSAVSNRSYTIQFRPALENGVWQKWQDVNVAPSNRTVWLTNSISAETNRFYRVATPIQP